MMKVGYSLLIAVALISAVASAQVCDPPVQTLSVRGGVVTTTEIAPGCSLSVKDNLKKGLIMSTEGTLVKISAPNRNIEHSFGKLTVSCPGKSACDRTLVVSSVEYHPTPVPTTPQPETQPPVIGTCSWGPVVLSARVGSSIVTSLNNDATSKCAITDFDTDSVTLKGRVSTDSKGTVGYYPSDTPEQVLGNVLVSCDGKPLCNLPVWFEAIALAPTLAPPGTPKPTVQPAACPSRYFFNVEPEVAHSGSLRGFSAEPFCAGRRSFRVLRLPSRGSLTLWASGDFRYNPAVKNDEDDFAFEMKCDDTFVCIASAFISIRKVDHSRDTPVPGSSNNQPPVTYKNTEFQTCSGSCSADSWPNSPTSSGWDTGLEQASGRPVGSVDVSWTRGTLNIHAYSKIGRLAERFPTFEKISNTSLTSQLDASGVLRAASQSSLPFDAQCLSQQAKDIGLGAEVWHAESQSLGDRYRQGSSWFHKFGGLHEQCDTFADGCKYAPLLNPPKSQKKADGVWSVNIDNCDVTWNGAFPYAALQTQRKSDGTRVWKTNSDRRLQATLYSEAIKPANWLSPSAGFLEQTQEYKLNVKLSEWVSAHKIDTSNTGASNPFTLDAEFFEYTASNGDRAFGLNMLFYPAATENPLSNFAADRRVHGFRVTRQEWFTPAKSSCVVDPAENGDEVFVSADLQKMKCKDGVSSAVSLTKGPATDEGSCEAEQRNVIYNRAGFSAPRGCSRNYQNLTIRGIAPGSASNTNAVDFEGSIEVQLLLSNGNRATVAVDMSLFVSMLSTSGESFTDGSVSLCRSSPYFPVYDPLGNSLPDDRHPLSAKLPAEVAKPHLCVDQLDKAFGPQGWAVIGFDVSEHSTRNLRVEQFGLRYPGSEGDVFMIYTDSVTGKPVSVPANIGSSWKETHPFLNFRDITYRAKNHTITSPEGAVMQNVDFAFAFMPGAINIETDVDVFCVIAVLDETGKVTSRPTLRQKIHVDPMLTSASRNGPELVADVEDVEAPENPYFFFATAAVIIAVIALGAIAMANDKLPVGKKSSQ